ncbi:MAG: peptide-methionine (S)-S-oxide reductase MsrA [Sulfuricella denitrificans]|nr:peptide-methionine (S)-S-oxide reductase MsrA [Sulfuricella denitrificans]
MNLNSELATFGGGCFWCLEAAFNELDGVTRVVSGYSGGLVDDPDYEAVCSGNTGHAEVVQVSFDPSVISYRELLTAFFTVHDPTTLNRQGNDAGTQYRSVIFYHSAEQEVAAQEMIDALSREHIWDYPIVTEVLPAPVFYPAEDYHRDYFSRNSQQPYCQVVVAPKVAKLRARFAGKLKQR